MNKSVCNLKQKQVFEISHSVDLHALSPLKPCFARVSLQSNQVQLCLAIALQKTAKQIKNTLSSNVDILDIVNFYAVGIL